MANQGESERLLDNRESFQNSAGFTKRRLCIFPIVTLYFFGFGILMYAVPEYVRSRVADEVKSDWHGHGQTKGTEQGADTKYNPCTSNHSSPEYKLHTEIQQESAKWLLYVGLCSYIPALVSNLILGSYSDIHGRIFVFGLCTVGNTLRCFIFTVVIFSKASLLFLLLGTLIDGVMGSFTVYFAVLFSYVSDITNAGRTRTMTIVFVELILGLTISVSSFASGYFIRSKGFIYPMLTATILSAVASISSLIFLPETLPRRGRSENKSCIKNVKRSAKFYTFSEFQSRLTTCKYILLILCFTFVAIPNMNRMTMEALYQLGRPFCWGPSKIGWFGTVKVACMSIVGMGVVCSLRQCVKDDVIAVVGAVMAIASFIVEGLAKIDAVLYTGNLFLLVNNGFGGTEIYW